MKGEVVPLFCLSPPILFYWPFQGGAPFVDPFCYIVFMFKVCLCNTVLSVSCSFVFLAAFPAGKGLIFWLSCVLCFLVFLSLSLVVSRVR